MLRYTRASRISQPSHGVPGKIIRAEQAIHARPAVIEQLQAPRLISTSSHPPENTSDPPLHLVLTFASLSLLPPPPPLPTLQICRISPSVPPFLLLQGLLRILLLLLKSSHILGFGWYPPSGCVWSGSLLYLVPVLCHPVSLVRRPAPPADLTAHFRSTGFCEQVHQSFLLLIFFSPSLSRLSPAFNWTVSRLKVLLPACAPSRLTLWKSPKILSLLLSQLPYASEWATLAFPCW